MMINVNFWQRSVGICFGLLAVSALQAQVLQNFVSVTPCRVVDTRSANGTFAGPILAGNSTRSFPLPQSTACSLPSNATAYSLNITILPTGGLGYLSIWPTGVTQPVVSTMNDFQQEIISNAAVVPAGNNGAISVYVTDQTHLLIDVNGYFVSVASSSSSNSSTAFGQGALPTPSSGGQNTAFGANALGANSTGAYNTAVGSTALNSNTTGAANTAYGQSALLANSTGSNNTAIGFQSLPSEMASSNNVAVGHQAMLGAIGNNSVAVGSGALALSAGSNNIAIGNTAGNALATGDNNIDIANTGLAADAGIIRIGTSGLQNATYIAGISAVNVTGGATVVVDANGQLGVVASSRRFKQDIQPMANASDRLMQLEPVTFRYKQAAQDGSQPLQFGLIAEQVAAVYPELAVYDKDGQVETLQYQQLPAMLLNEIQKQHQTIQSLETRLAELEKLLKMNAAGAGK